MILLGSETHNLKKETIKEQYDVVNLNFSHAHFIVQINSQIVTVLWTGEEAY
jgi:hypothetical protein